MSRKKVSSSAAEAKRKAIAAAKKKAIADEKKRLAAAERRTEKRREEAAVKRKEAAAAKRREEAAAKRKAAAAAAKRKAAALAKRRSDAAKKGWETRRKVKAEREAEREQKRTTQKERREFKALELKAAKLRQMVEDFERLNAAVTEPERYRMLHRDLTEALHPSLARHIPQDLYFRAQQRLGDAFMTEDESVVFYAVAEELNAPIGEIYTLFWSP